MQLNSSNLDFLYFFFFNDTATTEIYTLSLHDALPICRASSGSSSLGGISFLEIISTRRASTDRKSTRLNFSHLVISYAVFCLKKKKRHDPVSLGYEIDRKRCAPAARSWSPCVRRTAPILLVSIFFFFNDTATTEIYTLSLHDALPISRRASRPAAGSRRRRPTSCSSGCWPGERSEEHTSELQSPCNLVCRLLLEK